MLSTSITSVSIPARDSGELEVYIRGLTLVYNLFQSLLGIQGNWKKRAIAFYLLVALFQSLLGIQGNWKLPGENVIGIFFSFQSLLGIQGNWKQLDFQTVLHR